MAEAVGLRAEHRDAFGIGARRPRLSWHTETTAPGWRQVSYALDIDGQVFTVESDASVLVPWPAPPLASRQRRAVRVQVRGSDGTASAWSAPLIIEAGLMEASDWVARLVSPDVEREATALLRTGFVVEGSVERARLYVTALGVYEVELNGSPVGDHVLPPGWTSYDHRLLYQTFDVTGLVRAGANAIGARLADGWYRGRLGYSGGRSAIYGDRLALLAQLEVIGLEGRALVVATDGTWRAAPGPTLRASLYDGEDHDARLEPAGWSEAGFDDSAWVAAPVLARDLGTVAAPVAAPVRRVQRAAVQQVTTSPSGRTVLDFGQNLVGRLRFTVDGPAGTVVTLRHAEVLKDGELWTENLRDAAQTDRYTLRGGGPETWEPRFTFHGFRYAEVTGWPGDFVPGQLEAVVCHSDLERTGWFECSDDRVNRLHDNVVWSMRGNFVSVPTDCPQRDERMGWTGDIAVFAPTACFLHDSAGFLASWLRDLADEQRDDLGVPWVVPNIIEGWTGAAVWGDAAVVVPWTVYERTGDVGIVRDQYESMRRWAEFVVTNAGPRRLWEGVFQFGDWADPASPEGNPAGARTDRHLVANAAFCRSLGIMAQAAALLGHEEDAARYDRVGREAREAFAREYVTPNGRMMSDAQTAYALAVRFQLIADPVQRANAGRRLVQLVADGGHRIGTGFAGTPVITDALCDIGAVATAYTLLLQEAAPSWLYPVGRGATTIWERWEGIRPDGSLMDGQMNSFNHYALGAVADWLHRVVAGLAPAEPGYKRLLIRPLPGPGLTWARARHDTPYGRAEVGWERAGDGVVVTASVPPNTTATVVLPDGRDPFDVGPGAHRWATERLA